MKVSALAIAMMLGMAAGMNQNNQPPSFGGALIGSSGPGPETFRTSSGKRMQSFRRKKERNKKGKSR